MVTANNKNSDKRDDNKNRGGSPSNGHLNDDCDKDGGKYKFKFLVTIYIFPYQFCLFICILYTIKYMPRSNGLKQCANN